MDAADAADLDDAALTAAATPAASGPRLVLHMMRARLMTCRWMPTP